MEPKQIPLTKPMARAIDNNLKTLTALNAEVQAARNRLQTANEVGQQFLQALVLGAGFKPEEFASFNLWEDPETGNLYLRSTVQTPANPEKGSVQ